MYKETLIRLSADFEWKLYRPEGSETIYLKWWKEKTVQLRMVQYLQINQCDTPYSKLKSKNHMIISIGAEKLLIKFSIYLW